MSARLLSEECLFEDYRFDLEELIFDVFDECFDNQDVNPEWLTIDKQIEPPFKILSSDDWGCLVSPYDGDVNPPEFRDDSKCITPGPSFYDELVINERFNFYDAIRARLYRCMDTGETYEKYYIVDSLSKISNTSYDLCDEIIRVVRSYALMLERHKKPMDNILLMEAELTSQDFVKSTLPVVAIQRYMGVKKLIYIRLLWSMICYERVMVTSKSYLCNRILYTDTREALQDIEKEPYVRLIMETGKYDVAL